MLKEIRPQAYGRYLSFPLFGPILDQFDDWLIAQGYARGTRLQCIQRTAIVEKYFQDQGRHHLCELTVEDFHACWKQHHRRDRVATATISLLHRFLEDRKLLPTPAAGPSLPFHSYLEPYATYLKDVRGFARITIHKHLSTLSQLLEHLQHQRTPLCLVDLTASDLDDFIVLEGRRLSRGSMQHVVAQLRGFLRFLVMKGEVRSGLETQIDTPRQYRLEKLPRALPWETVCTFINSIERKTPVGLRDYAMFLLMATYGVRTSDIVDLTLDAIHWRHDEIWIHQRKTGQPLVLPLTDAMGSALMEYLRKGRPRFPYRQIFLRIRAPIHPIGNTAVASAFHFWAQRSGLEIPFYGPHCLRHSYAVHLLRHGVSVKTIGDLLGHRTAESTCVYLRLALEDLQEVALSIPQHDDSEVNP